MKRSFVSKALPLVTAAVMAILANSAHAQDVEVSSLLAFEPLGSGTFAYTLTLRNTGSEAIEGLWLGWALSSSPVFDVIDPTDGGNDLGWASDVDGNSIQYGGSGSESFLAVGSSGTFTFDSTSTPAQFMSEAAGQSVAYGVDASQFAIEDNSLHSVEFAPQVIPEPSPSGLLIVGAFSILCLGRRRVWLTTFLEGAAGRSIPYPLAPWRDRAVRADRARVQARPCAIPR